MAAGLGGGRPDRAGREAAEPAMGKGERGWGREERGRGELTGEGRDGEGRSAAGAAEGGGWAGGGGGLGQREYFIDVIGAVTMISDVATIRTKMRQTQTAKRSVTIQNESCTPLEVVLWGEQATSFPADQISIAGQDSLQIIIFVGTLARSYAGTTSLTGGSSCKWYVNPQVPEATSLAARYRLLITAGDETGETDFIVFGRMAQRIVKKPLDILIADNPPGFIPDEITKLMEKVYTFNVSFTDSTFALGNVCFQVNTVVAEIGDGGQVPISPSGSQPSSISSARAASKSTSADSVPTGGRLTNFMHFDIACKVANATIKRWVLSYQAGCEEDIGRLS
uniref:Replication protein A OB domain-containing protein n=1 Tax=Zea mays TaxID=4577 RepID=A0A804LYI7_MAIZE